MLVLALPWLSGAATVAVLLGFVGSVMADLVRAPGGFLLSTVAALVPMVVGGFVATVVGRRSYQARGVVWRLILGVPGALLLPSFNVLRSTIGSLGESGTNALLEILYAPVLVLGAALAAALGVALGWKVKKAPLQRR